MTIEIGKIQTLTVLKATEIGVYLGENDPEKSVLLPKKQVPAGTKYGDRIEVFVYRDSEDRPIATVRRPAATVGEFAYLSVKSVTRVGAFLDWGLEKDLFLPYKEQEQNVRSGNKVMVYLYLDKSKRISCTMKLYDYLSPAEQGEYRKEDAMEGVVYRYTPDFGAFTAVLPKGKTLSAGASFDKLFFGLIPPSQVFRSFRPGDEIKGRVVRRRADGKLDLSERKRDHEQIDADAETVIRKIEEYGGVLPFSESAEPVLVRRELSMSKSGFKRALGHLYKNHRIRIEENEVILLPASDPKQSSGNH